MRGPSVHQLWWEDLVYVSYDEGAWCMSVMMRGPSVRQLWWGGVVSISYDEGAWCMSVMMRGRGVRQLWWGGVVSISYDEGAWCMSVMMRGRGVRQLWWGGVVYISYDEGAWCMSVMMRGRGVRQLCVGRKRITKILEDEIYTSFTIQHRVVVFGCRFITLAKDSRYAWSHFGANIGWNHHLGSWEAANVSFNWHTSFNVCWKVFGAPF